MGANDVGRAMVPPKAIEAEQSVLGAVLLDARAFDAVGAMLEAGDFYEPEHAQIWSVIARLAAANKAVDVITVHEAGRAQGLRLEYLNALAQAVPSARNARGYAELVRDAALRRAVMRAAGDLMDAAALRGERAEPVTTLVDQAVGALLALLQGRGRMGEPQALDVVLVQFLDQLQAQSEGASPAIATGWHRLDHETGGGGRPGELWVVGARPSMGKSALMLGLSLHVARELGVLVLTQEDSAVMLTSRAVANRGGVNLADLRNPQRATHPDAMWKGAMDGVEELRPLHLQIDDQGGLTLMDVRRKVKQAQHRSRAPLRLVVVDYLQLMAGEGDNRNQMLGAIANGLKALAKEAGVWIVLLSQLSRKADESSGLPQISHLRDSGDIEGAADTIVLLHREIQRNQKLGPEWKNFAQAHVAKQKNGPTCTVNLHFDGALQRFSDWHGDVPGRGTGGGAGGHDAGHGRGFK